MGLNKALKKASEDGLTRKEVRTIANKYDVSRSDVRDRAETKGYTGSTSTVAQNPIVGNTTIDWTGKNNDPGTYVTAPGSSKGSSTATTSNAQQYPDGGASTDEDLKKQTDAQVFLFQNLYDFQQGLEITKNEGILNSTTIRADADKEIARIDADARKYGYELGLQGTKYGADKESEWRQAVANIEVKGKLDLQPIINAGLQRVAEIEGQSARDVADITSKGNIESMRLRTNADKELGKIQMAGGMYGLINSIFG